VGGVDAMTLAFSRYDRYQGRLHESNCGNGESDDRAGEVHGCNADLLPGRSSPLYSLKPLASEGTGMRLHYTTGIIAASRAENVARTGEGNLQPCQADVHIENKNLISTLWSMGAGCSFDTLPSRCHVPVHIKNKNLGPGLKPGLG
jgi:hypothetical protein